MNFLIFFLFYCICTLILFLIFLLLYKFFFKKLIKTKLAENTLLSAFDSLDDKSILDIDVNPDKKDEEEKNEEVYTYF